MILKKERKAEIVKFAAKELRRYLKDQNYIAGQWIKMEIKLIAGEKDDEIGMIISQIFDYK